MKKKPSQQPQTNHYLQHLTAVNDTQAVTASEDIFNQFGVLLIAKGSRINNKAQNQLQQHPLEKSIDNQIALETTISDKQIYQQTLIMLERSIELTQIQQSNKFDDPFRHICLSENLPLPMRQKLTIMSQQLPALWQHSLFNGWAAALIAKVMKLSPQACREAYICGLLHDIGLLHLPTTLQTQSPLDDVSWRAMQSHVVIGQNCADECGLPKSIGRGILEHHERLDQTGYPTRKPAKQLGLLGQIIGCTVLLHNLSTNELSQSEGSLDDAIPYFKIHRNSFNRKIHSALMKILATATRNKTATNRPAPTVNLERVRTVHNQLLALPHLLTALSSDSDFINHLNAQSVIPMIQSITHLLNHSGIGDNQLNDWLTSEIDTADIDNANSLKELDAMLYELLWLVKRLGWNLKDFMVTPSTDPNDAITIKLSHYQDQLNTVLEKAFTLYNSTSKEQPNDDDDLIDMNQINTGNTPE